MATIQRQCAPKISGRQPLRIGAEVTDGVRVGVVAAILPQQKRVLVITPRNRFAATAAQRWLIEPERLVVIPRDRMRYMARVVPQGSRLNVDELVTAFACSRRLAGPWVVTWLFTLGGGGGAC